MKKAFGFFCALLAALCLSLCALADASLVFSPNAVTVAKGKSQKVTVSVSDGTLGKPAKTVWETADKGIATVKSGTVTGKGRGSVTLTCTMSWKDGTTLTGILPVTVVQPVTSVKLNGKSKISLAQDETVKLQAIVAPENADDRAVVWSSGNEDVAIVGEDGTVTGIAPGSCKITAAARDGSGKKASVSVTVTPKYLVSVTKAKLTKSRIYPEIVLTLKNKEKSAVFSLSVNCYFYDTAGNSQSFKSGGNTIPWLVLTLDEPLKKSGSGTFYWDLPSSFSGVRQVMIAVASYKTQDGRSVSIPFADQEYTQAVMKGYKAVLPAAPNAAEKAAKRAPKAEATAEPAAPAAAQETAAEPAEDAAGKKVYAATLLKNSASVGITSFMPAAGDRKSLGILAMCALTDCAQNAQPSENITVKNGVSYYIGISAEDLCLAVPLNRGGFVLVSYHLGEDVISLEYRNAADGAAVLAELTQNYESATEIPWNEFTEDYNSFLSSFKK